MGDSPAAGVPVLEAGETGPTVPRMLAGVRLRRLREARRFTREEAARAIRSSPSKISRMELGRHGFKARDVLDLLGLYGVYEPAERTALLALVEQAGAPGWWRPYGDVVSPWFEPYLGSAGRHPAAGGPISILRFAQQELPDTVYLEQLSSARYPVNAPELTRYKHIMDRLVVQAAPPAETTELLRRIRAQL